MAVQSETMSGGFPWVCYESSGDWGSERTCGDDIDVRVILSGFTSNR